MFRKITFDENKINNLLSKVDKRLKEYIEKDILPEYSLNDGGHNINHINYVLKRAFELAEDINPNILYTCVTFHDIACHIDRDNHEVLSAEKAYNDSFLNSFFSKEEMQIIKEAIEDHRASLEYIPRNIYGKILSSSDRKVDVKEYLIASLSYGIKKEPNLSKEDQIKRSYDYAQKKFGKEGYAINKFYIEDKKYKEYLEDIQYLLDNPSIFNKEASIIYDSLIKE